MTPQHAFQLFALLGLTACGAGEPTPPGQAPLRRLTPTELNRTVADLYGFADDDWPEDPIDEDHAVWPFPLPPDVPVHGFEGMIEGQVASPYLAERVAAAARHFAAFAHEAPQFWICDDAERTARCAEDSVVRFAHRAWRRALTTAEERRLRDAHRTHVGQLGAEDGLAVSVAGVLSSPQFLYQAELQKGRTDEPGAPDWAMASRLSYFLWDSMPDPTLFERAAGGQLSTPGAVEAEVRRMLTDDRAREAVVHFHRQWLDLDSVYSTRADFDTYAPTLVPALADPDFIQEAFGDPDEDNPYVDQDIEELWSIVLIGLRAGMVRETELFVERTLFDGAGTLEALLTDNHGYVTDLQGELEVSTRQLYNVSDEQVHDGQEVHIQMDDGNLAYDLVLRPATYPADQRAGLLTQGAVLASRAHPVHPAPVLRGVFVLEQLTCTGMGQPPDGAEAAAPPDSLDAASTNRERLAAATADPVCAGCHDTINPVGFAFENYDSIGGWRDRDNGVAVDASGAVRLPGGHAPVTVNDAVGLARALADSRVVYDCYARHWTRYAMGRELTEAEEPDLGAIQDAFWGSRGDVRELLVAIATSPFFLTQTAGE